MKRRILLLLAIIMLLPGCSLFQKDSPSLEERIISEDAEGERDKATPPEVVEMEGYIEENDEKSLFEKGTHVLTDDKGNILFLLESEFEDLSEYAEKVKVLVKGEKYVAKENTYPFIQVFTVTMLETPPSANPTKYSSEKLGLTLVLPPKWEYEEEDAQIAFYANKESNDPVFILELFPLESDQGADLQEKMDEGTEITVDGKRSFRFMNGSTHSDIYVFLGKEVLFIQFLGNDEEKVDFYDILLSIKFDAKYDEPEEVKECGGDIGFICEEGYRCELSSDLPDAMGTCIKIGGEDADGEDLEEAEIRDEEENTEEEEEDPNVESRKIIEEEDIDEEGIPESKAEEDEAKVMEYIRNNINSLAPNKTESGSSWSVKLFAFSEGDLVSAEYEDSSNAEVKRKLLFQYTLDGEKVTLTEKGYFEPGEETDWKIKTGESLQSGQAHEVYSPEGEKKASVSEGYVLYESSHYDFTVEYPKNFYYAHLGKVEGSLSTLVFSNAPATDENALFTLEILDGKKEKEIQSDRVIILPRDENTHFQITASDDASSEDLKHMSETLTSTL